VTVDPARISPAEGERRLCSAMTETPGRVSASENGRSVSRADRRQALLEVAQRHRLAPAAHVVTRRVDDPFQRVHAVVVSSR
jgi:hypothetical protein